MKRSLDQPWKIRTTTTEASSVRGLFSSLELDRLRAMFNNEIITTAVPISKPKVKDILRKEDGGKEILQKASLETILNRVKYERRLTRSKAANIRVVFKNS